MARPKKSDEPMLLSESKPVSIKKLQDMTATLKNVNEITADKVVNTIASAKLNTTKLLEEVANQVQSELKQLDEIRDVINVEKQFLQDLYNIKVEATTLDDLKTSITETKDAWKKEQQEHETMVRERDSNLNKERVRENDEYTYNQRIKRRSEEDAFKQSLSARLNEVIERENKVQSQEDAIKVMEMQVASIPKTIEEAVTKAVNEAESKLHSKYGSQLAAEKREVTFQTKLFEQEKNSLNEKIASLVAQNAELTKRADEASKMAQEVAKEAIQASGKAKVVMSSGSDK